MRDDNFTNEMKLFTYFLFKISDLLMNCGLKVMMIGFILY